VKLLVAINHDYNHYNCFVKPYQKSIIIVSFVRLIAIKRFLSFVNFRNRFDKALTKKACNAGP